MTQEYNQSNMGILERLMFKLGWVSKSRVHNIDTPEQIVAAFTEAAHEQDMLDTAKRLAAAVFPGKTVVALEPGGEPNAVTLIFSDNTKGQADGTLWLQYLEAG